MAPARDLQRICREARPSHLVRLLAPDQLDDLAEDTSREVLTLLMHDISEPATGLIAPDSAMVRRLLDFARTWRGERPLVAQCWAGVSRSTAAAFVIACEKRPDVAEQSLAAALRRASPQATPNPLMVAHADALLGRGGRIIAAVQAMGRGAEFSDFACAELNLAALQP